MFMAHLTGLFVFLIALVQPKEMADHPFAYAILVGVTATSALLTIVFSIEEKK